MFTGEGDTTSILPANDELSDGEMPLLEDVDPDSEDDFELTHTPTDSCRG